MRRARRQKGGHAHYCILVNQQATEYSDRRVDRLVSAIRKTGRQYSVLRPKSAIELYQTALEVAKTGRVPGRESRSGPSLGNVSALVAAGGDGTVNLVARAVIESGLPMGVLPMGRFNNISMSLQGKISTDEAIDKILSGKYRSIDTAKAGDQMFIGSIGFGFIPSLATILNSEKPPRFGMGWGKLAAKAAEGVRPTKMIVKADAFRFELTPVMVAVNLLPYSVGLRFSPASLSDDGRAEVIFDRVGDSSVFPDYLRQLRKDKYKYGDQINLYRSEVINIQLPSGQKLYLDGEMLELPGQALEIRFAEAKLKMFL